MSTTCCACFAKTAVRGSQGFIVTPRWLGKFAGGAPGVPARLILRYRSGQARETPLPPPHSLHDDFRRHLRMDRTEIRVHARLDESESELLVGVERLRLEGRL